MLVSLLSLVGVPPLAGFVGKFALFVATMQAGYTWLTVLGLMNSALSLFYYLRVIAPMFVPPAGAPPEAPEPIAKAIGVVAALGSIVLRARLVPPARQHVCQQPAGILNSCSLSPARARVRTGCRRHVQRNLVRCGAIMDTAPASR
jgi:NADH:ubiquinone oxidoreductase subunit 2 (subunit N)